MLKRMSSSWDNPGKVHEYVDRIRQLGPRQTGETELLEALPDPIDTLLDLGCGDGRLSKLVLGARPEMRRVVA